MPPRKHVAKSQEHIYVKVGQGGRTTYKLRATDIPQAMGSSSGASVAEAPQIADPIISPPSADDTQSFNNNSNGAEDYETRPKRTGKVCQSLSSYLNTLLTDPVVSAAI